MAIGDSDRLLQVQCRAEGASNFCNLTAAINGTPNANGFHIPGSDPAVGVTLASPEFEASYEVAENEEARNRPFRNTPVLLTRACEVSADVYLRGNGSNPANVFTDRTFTYLDAFFGISSTHAVEHDIVTFTDAVTFGIVDAYENGLRAGMGLHIVLPTGKSHVTFVQSITNAAPAAEDTVVCDPPMTAGELAACIAAGTVAARGGRTYAVGDEYREGTSLYALLYKQAYGQEAFGLRGSTITANLETGQAGMMSTTLMGPFTHQGGWAPAMAVTTWDTVDTITVADTTSLRVGMYAKVTTTLAPAGDYIVRIQAIPTGSTVTFEPTGLPAGITGEGPVPALQKPSPGSTAAPAGKWLVFLNGRAWADGQYRNVKAANWSLNMNPIIVETPNNMAGAVDMVMGEPEVTCEVTYSHYDDGEQFQNFLGETQFSVLCMLGDGTPGNAVAFYCPQMHNAEAPVPGEADNLTTLETNLRAGLATADDDPYDGVNPSNTICRLFFAW